MKPAAPKDLRDLSIDELVEFLKTHGHPRYRAEQIFSWLYGSDKTPPVAAISEMANLPEALRDDLQKNFTLFTPSAVTVQRDPDTTTKFLLRLSDSETVECVLIPETIKTGFEAPRAWRKTLCVSSQVGCAIGCTFCRTATMGLKRNMTPSEILAQIIAVQRYLAEHEPDGKIRNLVFMGMGEPLHNYQNVKSALARICDAKGLGFSKRRVTVSTSGLLPEIQNLLDDTEVRLAISLNAADEATRLKIMPITKKYSLESLLALCRRLSLPRRDRITFEYVLLAGVNDSDEDAARLVSLMHGIKGKINLLAFNEFPGSPFKRPSEERVQRFRALLNRKGLQVNIRQSRGRTVLAACGQLRSAVENAETV